MLPSQNLGALVTQLQTESGRAHMAVACESLMASARCGDQGGDRDSARETLFARSRLQNTASMSKDLLKATCDARPYPDSSK